MANVGSHRCQEDGAKFMQQRRCDIGGIASGVHRAVDGGQRGHGVTIDERLEQRIEMFATLRSTTGSNNLVKSRQRVACRSSTSPDHIGAIFGRDLDARVGNDMVDKPADLRLRQQRKLEVLRATPNRWHDLVGLGRAQHERDMRRWLFERLQQSVLGARRQHVHLVEDVHLVAAWRPECDLADEVTHCVDTIVRRGIEFVQVVASAGLECDARIAFVARLAALQIGAVQRLGQDARRRRLAGAARPAEQVRVADAVAFNCVAKGRDDVFLSEECVCESRGSVTPIQRLIGHCCRA